MKNQDINYLWFQKDAAATAHISLRYKQFFKEFF